MNFSEESYMGHNNIEIKNLEKEKMDNLNAIKKIENKIKKIQSDCSHEYKFVARGMYEDAYTCCKCGHDFWK